MIGVLYLIQDQKLKMKSVVWLMEQVPFFLKVEDPIFLLRVDHTWQVWLVLELPDQKSVRLQLQHLVFLDKIHGANIEPDQREWPLEMIFSKHNHHVHLVLQILFNHQVVLEDHHINNLHIAKQNHSLVVNKKFHLIVTNQI